MLVAYTRESLDAGARAAFDALLGDPSLDDAQITALQQTIRDSGALDRVEELISRSAAEADDALRGADLGTEAMQGLLRLSRDATARAA